MSSTHPNPPRLPDYFEFFKPEYSLDVKVADGIYIVCVRDKNGNIVFATAITDEYLESKPCAEHDFYVQMKSVETYCDRYGIEDHIKQKIIRLAHEFIGYGVRPDNAKSEEFKFYVAKWNE